MALGEHFMHRGDRKPAAQRRIRCRMAERDLVEACASPCVSIRSMRPRKFASVLVRAVLMRRSFRKFGRYRFFPSEPAAGSFVHDMF